MLINSIENLTLLLAPPAKPEQLLRLSLVKFHQLCMLIFKVFMFSLKICKFLCDVRSGLLTCLGRRLHPGNETLQ